MGVNIFARTIKLATAALCHGHPLPIKPPTVEVVILQAYFYFLQKNNKRSNLRTCQVSDHKVTQNEVSDHKAAQIEV